MRYIWADFTDLSMDYTSIAVLIGAVLDAASVVFGAKYNQGKAKASVNRSILENLANKFKT